MDRARELGVSPAPRFLLVSYSTGKRGRSSPQVPGHREPSRSRAGGFACSRSQHGEEARGGIGGILLQRELNIHDQHILPPGQQSQEGWGQLRLSQRGDNKPHWCHQTPCPVPIPALIPPGCPRE